MRKYFLAILAKCELIKYPIYFTELIFYRKNIILSIVKPVKAESEGTGKFRQFRLLSETGFLFRSCNYKIFLSLRIAYCSV